MGNENSGSTEDSFDGVMSTAMSAALEIAQKKIQDAKPKSFKYFELEGLEKFDIKHPWKTLTFSKVNHSKNYQILSDTKVLGQASGSTDYIALSQIFNINDKINRIIFEIKPTDRVQGNIIGLMEYPLPFNCDNPDLEIDLNGALWSCGGLELAGFGTTYHGIGTFGGAAFGGPDDVVSDLFDIWMPPQNVLAKFQFKQKFEFMKNDTLKVYVDLENEFIDIYVNIISDNFKIIKPNAEHTFTEIPEQFIFFYGYDDRSIPLEVAMSLDDNIDVSKYINVTVDLELVDLQINPNKKDKGKRIKKEIKKLDDISNDNDNDNDEKNAMKKYMENYMDKIENDQKKAIEEAKKMSPQQAQQAMQEKLDKIHADFLDSQPKHFAYITLDNLKDSWNELTFSNKYHSDTYNVLSETQVYGKAEFWKTDSIILEQIFDCNVLDRVIFKISPKGRAAGNNLGILAYPILYSCDNPDEIEIDSIKDEFVRVPLELSEYQKGFYCIGSNDGQLKLPTWKNEWNIWTPGKYNFLGNLHEMKYLEQSKNDIYIVVFDLANKFGDIYLNEMDDKYKIHRPDDQHTFNIIPDKFVFMYGYTDVSIPMSVIYDEEKMKNMEPSRFVNVTVDVELVELNKKHVQYKINKRPKDDVSDDEKKIDSNDNDNYWKSYICSKCGFGNKKNECFKCNKYIGASKKDAKRCRNCSFGVKKTKCIKCNGHLNTKKVDAYLCMKCGFGQDADKCVICGKLI